LEISEHGGIWPQNAGTKILAKNGTIFEWEIFLNDEKIGEIIFAPPTEKITEIANLRVEKIIFSAKNCGEYFLSRNFCGKFDSRKNWIRIFFERGKMPQQQPKHGNHKFPGVGNKTVMQPSGVFSLNVLPFIDSRISVADMSALAFIPYVNTGHLH
jgi:hypothetical protein